MVAGKLKLSIRPETLLVLMVALFVGLCVLVLHFAEQHQDGGIESATRVMHASQFAYMGRGVPGGAYVDGAYASGSNYLADIIAGGDGAHRWAQGKFPLKVFIADGSGVPGYRPQMRQLMAQAFQDWQDATHGVVSWRQVTSPERADIVATWTASAQARSGGIEAGNTETLTSVNRYTGNGDIQAAKITILTGIGGRPFSDAELRKTTLHEVGHAFGLEGHSHVQSDIMYPAVNAAQTPYLRARDVNTMAMLYGTGAGSGPYDGMASGGYGASPYAGYGMASGGNPYAGYGAPAPAMAAMPRGRAFGSIAGQLARQWLQQRMGGYGF